MRAACGCDMRSQLPRILTVVCGCIVTEGYLANVHPYTVFCLEGTDYSYP